MTSPQTLADLPTCSHGQHVAEFDGIRRHWATLRKCDDPIAPDAAGAFPELPTGALIFVRRIEWVSPKGGPGSIDLPEPVPALVSDGRADCMGGIEINVRPEHLPEGIPVDHTLWAPLVTVSLPTGGPGFTDEAISAIVARVRANGYDLTEDESVMVKLYFSARGVNNPAGDTLILECSEWLEEVAEGGCQ